jgi:Peptidase family M28
VFDGRIYRTAFVPLLLALVVAGFSLSGNASPLRSTLAPDAFDGARAFAELRMLAHRFPDRRPGSAGDRALASYVEESLRALGGTAGGGFLLSSSEVSAQTIEGQRTLENVIATRPGSTGLAPIAILAHRDAASPGSSAELSGTAALIELARVFAHSETRRSIVIVSTSGGSGGYGGAAGFASNLSTPLDAAIVLGDVAGQSARRPFVLPFSATGGTASGALVNTVSSAVSQETGMEAGATSASASLAHLVFPLATGEESPIQAAGTPSVLLQVSGERGPSTAERVSEARLQSFGRAALSAVYALDEGPEMPAATDTGVTFPSKTLPGWAVRLLALALMLPVIVTCIDALARVRRRREPVLRWVLWTLMCALPALCCALFAILLGLLGIVAAPHGVLSSPSIAADPSARGAAVAAVLVLALSALCWPALARRFALPVRPVEDSAGLGPMLVLLAVALLVWLANPFASLLLVPALHLWLLACSPDLRRRALAYASILASLAPLALLLLAYALELGLGPSALAENAVLLPAGGGVGLFGALVWSVAFGCLASVLLLTRPRVPIADGGQEEWMEISTRGPLTYAGPGSLGGTESALRR